MSQYLLPRYGINFKQSRVLGIVYKLDKLKVKVKNIGSP